MQGCSFVKCSVTYLSHLTWNILVVFLFPCVISIFQEQTWQLPQSTRLVQELYSRFASDT